MFASWIGKAIAAKYKLFRALATMHVAGYRQRLLRTSWDFLAAAAQRQRGEGSSVTKVIASMEEVNGRKLPRKIVARRPADPRDLAAVRTRARRLL